MIEVGPRERVLHLGFGDGAGTCDFARRAREGLALGVDPSADRVRSARKAAVELENVMFVLGTPEEVPWQEGFFSLVVCEAAPTDWARAAREIFRVTSRGGRVYVTGPPPRGEELFRTAGFEAVQVSGLRLEARKP